MAKDIQRRVRKKLKEEITIERKRWEQMLRQAKEEWRKEKELLEKKIEKLEWEKERKDRQEKKKITVSGQKFEEKLEEKIEGFLEKALKVAIKVKNIVLLGRGINKRESKSVVAKLLEWEETRMIMARKKDLDRGIYIDDYLTRKERE